MHFLLVPIWWFNTIQLWKIMLIFTLWMFKRRFFNPIDVSFYLMYICSYPQKLSLLIHRNRRTRSKQCKLYFVYAKSRHSYFFIKSIRIIFLHAMVSWWYPPYRNGLQILCWLFKTETVCLSSVIVICVLLCNSVSFMTGLQHAPNPVHLRRSVLLFYTTVHKFN